MVSYLSRKASFITTTTEKAVYILVFILLFFLVSRITTLPVPKTSYNEQGQEVWRSEKTGWYELGLGSSRNGQMLQ